MGAGEEVIHQWLNGKLVCMRRISIGWDGQNECFTLVVMDRIDNKLAEVYHNTFPSDNAEHSDISMKCQDLEYHGGSPKKNSDFCFQHTLCLCNVSEYKACRPDNQSGGVSVCLQNLLFMVSYYVEISIQR